MNSMHLMGNLINLKSLSKGFNSPKSKYPPSSILKIRKSHKIFQTVRIPKIKKIFKIDKINRIMHIEQNFINLTEKKFKLSFKEIQFTINTNFIGYLFKELISLPFFITL